MSYMLIAGSGAVVPKVDHAGQIWPSKRFDSAREVVPGFVKSTYFDLFVIE